MREPAPNARKQPAAAANRAHLWPVLDDRENDEVPKPRKSPLRPRGELQIANPQLSFVKLQT